MTTNYNRECKELTCKRPTYARDWCNLHFVRARDSGTWTTFDIYRECLECGTDTQTNAWFCSDCKTKLTTQERTKIYKHKHYSENVERYVESKKKNPTTKEEARFYNLKYSYGLTKDEFVELVKAQDNKCAVCKTDVPEDATHHKRLALDHDHASGKPRGLLCFGCNTALGHLHDDIELLKNAIEYLQREEKWWLK